MEYIKAIFAFIVVYAIISAVSGIGKEADRLTVSGSTKWRRTPIQAWFRQVLFGIIGLIVIIMLLGGLVSGVSGSKTEQEPAPITAEFSDHEPNYNVVPSTVSPTAGAPYSPNTPATDLEAELPPK